MWLVWKVFNRMGFRGLFLLVLGVMDIGYGSAIHASVNDNDPQWWPATQSTVGGISIHTWAWAWIVGGVFILTGTLTRKDYAQFAVAVLMKMLWAGSVIGWWVQHESAGGWGVASIYGGFALITLLVAAWPDTPRKRRGP